MQTIYLDYNATTPIDPSVVESMNPALSHLFGNPSSSHLPGIEARKLVEKARSHVAGLLNCQPEEIVFTSGGTESNNHAIKGIVNASTRSGKHIITSTIEHPATLEVCKYLQQKGYDISYINVDTRGIIILEELESAIRKDTILITVMHANNEIGSIQPIPEISQLARKHKIPFHTDAAQSAGKVPVDVQQLGVDLLSLAGHKIYGPKGIGALYIRSGLTIEKLIHGADHEKNRRAGTENVPQITGLGKACEIAKRDLEINRQTMQKTRDALFSSIRESIPEVKWNGNPENCLPNTLSLSFPGVEAQLILSRMEGVAASAGAACHAEHTNVSHVLDAIGLSAEKSIGTIRFSTGKNTTVEEISSASRMIIDTALPLMTRSGSKSTTSSDATPVKLTQFTHGLGCACKMRPQDLEKILHKIPMHDHPDILVDARNSDDATVWKIGEDTAWVQSVDFFTPVVDDPFTFGAIAVVNALSDIYAMGATPLFGLNIVAFPVRRLALSVLDEILQGALSIAEKAGIHILGGHTIEDNELKFGMVVNGKCHPDNILQNSTAQPGDALILTKPIGTGIMTTALKKGILADDHYHDLVDVMTGLNNVLSDILPSYKVNACTDITGFGLLGHLLEMVRASKVSAELMADKVPLIKGAMEYYQAGTIPGGTLQNLSYAEPFLQWKKGTTDGTKTLLADAQTSGGLLLSAPQEKARKLLEMIHKGGSTRASIIGRILPASDFSIIIK
jgi:cysteine desulfurase NifS/selenium donor protein